MRILFRNPSIALALLATVGGCSEPAELDADRAAELIRAQMFDEEPAYAEVPAEVWWSDASPKDDFDERSLATLRNLEQLGLITLEEVSSEEEVRWTSERVGDGVRILGSVPSARGRAWRARIATRKIDEITSFERHPSEPHAGRAEILWHYTDPTDLYDAFETKIDKPLETPFASVVSINLVDGRWQVRTIIRKKGIRHERH